MKIMIVPATRIEHMWRIQYEERRKVSYEKKVELLRKRAEKLGFSLVPLARK